ncbi:MAG: hypothetical protein R6X20_00155 [Phycisphaerae bacterium]
MPHPKGPTDDTRALLEAMSWAEILGIGFEHIERHLKPSLPASSRDQRWRDKSHHADAYRDMVNKNRRILGAILTLLHEDSDIVRDALRAGVRPAHLKAMWDLAKIVAEKGLSLRQAAKEAEGVTWNQQQHAARKHPLLWEAILTKVGLGCRGRPEDAPQRIGVRARMRKWARLSVLGLPHNYAAAQMGFDKTTLWKWERDFPHYWESLEAEAREDLGLPKGHRLQTRVLDEEDRVVTWRYRRRRHPGQSRWGRRREETPEQPCPVRLHGRDKAITIYVNRQAVQKPMVSPDTYDVLHCLTRAWPDRMTAGQIKRQTHPDRMPHRDNQVKQPHQCIRRLRKDPDWNRLIVSQADDGEPGYGFRPT